MVSARADHAHGGLSELREDGGRLVRVDVDVHLDVALVRVRVRLRRACSWRSVLVSSGGPGEG